MGAKAHGHFLAGDVGELAGVSGTTIGQWARRGYIRPSQSAALPHVYSVEDAAEAAMVAELLARGVRRADVRRAIGALDGDWPLSDATLATDGRGLFLRDGRGLFALGPRGWQRVVVEPDAVEDVRLRFRRPAAA